MYKNHDFLAVAFALAFLASLEYYDGLLNKEAIKEIHWYEIKGNKNEPLHPQTEESIEWIRWVPKNELGNYLHNSYNNIREIISKYSR